MNMFGIGLALMVAMMVGMFAGGIFMGHGTTAPKQESQTMQQNDHRHSRPADPSREILPGGQEIDIAQKPEGMPMGAQP
jgi:hypothetical protein